MDMMVTEQRPDPQFWQDFLNERAVELGLEKAVKFVKAQGGIGVITWVYENEGVLIDLGWSVEAAEASLRALAGG